MKKSLIVISCLILVLSVALSACGGPVIMTDSSKNTHVIVTDKKGNMIQNDYGDVYEEIVDKDGNTVTQIYRFDEVITNKRNTKLETAVMYIEVPKKWYNAGYKDYIRLCHDGDCKEKNGRECQIEIRHYANKSIDEVYGTYINNIGHIAKLDASFSDFKEEESKLFGIKGKLFSYKAKEAGASSYYYCFQKGVTIFEFTATVYDDCYTRAEIEELISSSCTLKDLCETPSAAKTTTAPAKG